MNTELKQCLQCKTMKNIHVVDTICDRCKFGSDTPNEKKECCRYCALNSSTSWTYCSNCPCHSSPQADTEKKILEGNGTNMDLNSGIQKHPEHHVGFFQEVIPPVESPIKWPKSGHEGHVVGLEGQAVYCDTCKVAITPTPENDWEEELRVKVNFDKNQDRQVCILIIKRLIQQAEKDHQDALQHAHDTGVMLGKHATLERVRKIVKTHPNFQGVRAEALQALALDNEEV